MKKHILLLILLSFTSLGVNSQNLSDDNFIYTAVPKKAVKAAEFNTLTKDQVTQNITYFDGLGRPVQTVAIHQGANGEDIITPIEYDPFGRQAKENLPYPLLRTNNSHTKIDLPTALAAQQTFYYTPEYDNTLNPYSEKEFEASPLNRIFRQAAPGNDWKLGNGHEIKLDYQTNTAADLVKIYSVTTLLDANGVYVPTVSSSANYTIGQLYKNITKDENWTSGTNNTTEEFKNKQGQVILKRTYNNSIAHDTYYIYDDYGNLTYVLPPKAEGDITETVLNNLCYRYKYDYRNRLIEKKLPGKQWEFIVYDKLDRPVATGPANSPFSDITTTGWIITKYDAFNRPVYTGWMNATPATAAGRTTLQAAQNDAALTVLNESKLTSGTLDGIAAYYSNTVAPTSFKLLTVAYYDNYTFPSTPAIAIPASVEGQTTLTGNEVKGLPTASWTRVPTTSTASLGETTATFYDAKARPVRIYTTNHLGGYTYTDSKLDSFSGQLQYSITGHKRAASDVELTTKDVFTYSAQDRLLTQTHQIIKGTYTGPVELIASNTYDQLGQLISKKTGNTEALPTQKIDYTYNIRGWLTGINNMANLQQGTDPKDLFAFRLSYNTTPTNISGVSALYNGNIAETAWKTNSDLGAATRGYGYQYDNLNRLTNAVSQKNSAVNNTYNELLSYDKNGNIMSLQRNGTSDATATAIDNLVYSYGSANSTNQLTKVADSSNKTVGFADGSNTGDDYTYDANGNMITDANKNITAITYNHLNLPAKITFASSGNIVYLYNATGQKVQKVVTQGATVTTTDYLAGYQYENSALKFFPTAEGYVEPEASSYKYIFQYKDHLGNVRLSYDKTLAIKEESNYYAFGLKQEGYNTVKIGVENKYKYNGKELQDELGLNVYDYGARNYDPALGRWMNVDPLAEISRRNSPYVYALNNPVFFIDPDGMADASHRDRTPEKELTPTPEIPNFRNNFPERWAVDEKSIDPSKKGEGTDTGNRQYVGQDGLPNGKDMPAEELNEVVVKGYKSQSYFQGYFDAYKHIEGENPYSPYIPDGYGLTISGSVDYNFTTYSASFSLVLDGHTNEFAGFTTFGSGLSTGRIGGGFGASIDILDTYGGSNLFDGIKDYSRGGGASYNYLGVSHYQSVNSVNGQFINSPQGVTSNSLIINFKPSTGANYGVTKTKRLF